MERVWHGSHRKPNERNWSLYFSLVLLVILVGLIGLFPL